MPATWNPKYPDFANRKAGAGLNDEDTAEQWAVKGLDGTVKPLEWMLPPPTSHLDSFAYESARIGSPYFNRLAKITGRSKLHVRFKPSGKQTRTTHYVYFFTDDSYGEATFEKMKAAIHPGAEVVNQILIANAVPYERVH